MTALPPQAAPLRPPPTLRRRAEFLAVRGGGKSSGRTFLLEWRKRGEGDSPDGPARFGYTVTKKTGVAVVRNRIRRRLREAVRLFGAQAAEPGCDYVLVGRPPALDAPFGEIVAELAKALDRARRFNANPRQTGQRSEDGRRPDEKRARPGLSASREDGGATKRR